MSVGVGARNPVLLREKDEQDVYKKQLTQNNIKIVFFMLLV
jgi:hypothetical protein